MDGRFGAGISTFFAILIVCSAQLFRIYRMRLIVYKKGEISNRILSRSIGISYLANLILPLRLGEFIRVFYLRRKQFGTFATLLAVFIERLFDSIFITFFFAIYLFLSEEKFQNFLIISSAITIGFGSGFYYTFRPRKEKLKIFRFFSEDLQLQLNHIVFQMYLVLSKVRFNLKAILGYSFLINIGILISILFLSNSLKSDASIVSKILVFDPFNSISIAMIELAALSGEGLIVFLYFLFPILMLLIPISREIANKKEDPAKAKLDAIRDSVIPESKSANNDIYVKESIFNIASSGEKGLSKIQTETLREVKLIDVLQGGGSGDQVFLIARQGDSRVRKSASISRRDFLKEQNRWMSEYSATLPIVKVSEYIETSNSAYYDMEYLGINSSLFEVMHSSGLVDCKEMLNVLLGKLNRKTTNLDLQNNHQSYEAAYRTKVIGIFDIIEKSGLGSYLVQPCNYEGRALDAVGTKELLRFLSGIKLPSQESWIMHGDLTVSNMLVVDGDIILIDPNPIQPFNHPSVDFGKLLQSFKCGYEFDYKKPRIVLEESNVRVLNTRSLVFSEMEKHLYDWISQYSKIEYIYHARIQLLLHLLRIVPYSENSDQIIWLIIQVRITITELNAES